MIVLGVDQVSGRGGVTRSGERYQAAGEQAGSGVAMRKTAPSRRVCAPFGSWAAPRAGPACVELRAARAAARARRTRPCSTLRPVRATA